MSKSARKLVPWLALIVMFSAIYGVLRPPPGAAPPPEPGEPTGGSFVFFGVSVGALFLFILGMRRLGAAGQQHRGALHASQAHLEAGRFDEAEAPLGATLASRLPHYRRAAQVQRAEIAFRRGDRAEAMARVDEALAAPVTGIFAGGQRSPVASARALSAFLRASSGDEARARADLEAARALPEAEPAAMARAALAEALLLEHGGDRAALRALVDRSRALWSQSCGRPDRALARAYEAMLDAGSAPVYRQQAGRAEGGARVAATADWVARYAPSAAPFVRTAARDATGGEAVSLPPPTEEATRKVEAARPPFEAKKNNAPAVAVWVVLILVFLSVWKFTGVSWLLPAQTLAGLGGLVAWIVWRARRERAENRRLRAAIRAHGLGDTEAAVTGLATEPRAPWPRVQAAHFRAEIALNEGQMAKALAEVDRAFVAMTEALGTRVVSPAPAADGVPGWDFQRVLSAQRATALAALGRGDEARAELLWANGFPSELPRLRVALIERLAVHDFEGAARLVEGCPEDLSPATRDEVLFDLIRFVARAGARGEGEAETLRREVGRQASLRAWLDAVAPGLWPAFETAAG
jgi:hypothetical protein